MARSGRTRKAGALGSIVYKSRASYEPKNADLLKLLGSAREANAIADVTGVLVYDRGWFFQAIEGPEASLTEVMNRIRRDPRHHEIEIVQHQPIPSRMFPGWTMNLAQRAGRRPAAPGDFVIVEAAAMDELHSGDQGVQLLLASLSVTAWEETKG